MVAADTRRTIFEPPNKDEKGDWIDNFGSQIMALLKDTGELHVLYNKKDQALVLRRFFNWGRAALGQFNYRKDKIDDKIKIKAQGLFSEDFTSKISPGFMPGKQFLRGVFSGGDDIGHNYQDANVTMDYYVEHLPQKTGYFW